MNVMEPLLSMPRNTLILPLPIRLKAFCLKVGMKAGKAGVVCKTLTLRNRMLTLTSMKWFVMQRKKELKLSAITRPEGIFPTMSARWIMLCNGTQTTVSMSLRQDMRELSRMVIFITANMGSTTIRKWWKQLPVTK